MPLRGDMPGNVADPPLFMTTTDTNTNTMVETNLVQLVDEYCQLEKKAQSKFSALTEKAIEMFEHGFDEKKVGKEFRLAFAEAKGLEAKGLSKNAEYREFRRRILEMLTIAKRGRQWYKEHKAKETGFYRMHQLAQTESKLEDAFDAVPIDFDEASEFYKQLITEAQKFVASKFFTQLAVFVESKDKGQLPVDYGGACPSSCSNLLTLVQRR